MAHFLTRLTGVVWCTASVVAVTAKLPPQYELDRPAANIYLPALHCELTQLYNQLYPFLQQ